MPCHWIGQAQCPLHFPGALHYSPLRCTQDVAERVAREAARRHYAPRVLPADAYLPMVARLPAEPALVWVASTTGQGEPPDNMRQLWRVLLRKSLAPGSLAGLRAAVFGLGDSGCGGLGGEGGVLDCSCSSLALQLPNVQAAMCNQPAVLQLNFCCDIRLQVSQV